MGRFMCVFLALTIGCSGKPDPISQKSDKDALPQSLTVEYKGRNAEFWGKKLLDADDAVSRDAAFALNHIGKEGLRFVAKGMESEKLHVRFNAADKLHHQSAKDYPDVFVPLLAGMLKEKGADIRHFAALHILSCGFKQALPAMREARDNLTNPGEKSQLTGYIQGLETK